MGEVAEEGGAGLAGEADAAVGGWHAEDIPDVQPDAIVGEAHEEGHGAVVEVGAVVAIFLADAEKAGGGGVRRHAGAHGEIHGQPAIHKVLAALVAQLDDNAALRAAAAAAAQLLGVLPCAQGGAVGRAAAESGVILRDALLIGRQFAIARGAAAADDPRRRLGHDGRRRGVPLRFGLPLPRVPVGGGAACQPDGGAKGQPGVRFLVRFTGHRSARQPGLRCSSAPWLRVGFSPMSHGLCA